MLKHFRPEFESHIEEAARRRASEELEYEPAAVEGLRGHERASL